MTTEQRLREAFAALADAVDTKAEPLPVRRRRWLPLTAAAAMVVLVALAGVLWVTQPQRQPATQLMPYITTTVPSPTYTPRIQVAYELYTHCGIDDARVDGKYYEAETPIPEPLPNDWGNPYQAGTMTDISPTQVEFRDNKGHVVRFKLRPGATKFKRTCD